MMKWIIDVFTQGFKVVLELLIFSSIGVGIIGIILFLTLFVSPVLLSLGMPKIIAITLHVVSFVFVVGFISKC